MDWIETPLPALRLRAAAADDVPLILRFIRELAAYEQLADQVTADVELLTETLFGQRRVAEVVLGYLGGEPVGFALYFHNFSTFVGRPGLYLEDLYVVREHRGGGVGRVMLGYLAHLARERGCGRLEWWVLDWNQSAIDFYASLGAVPMDDWTVFRLQGEPLVTLADTFSEDGDAHHHRGPSGSC